MKPQHRPRAFLLSASALIVIAFALGCRRDSTPRRTTGGPRSTPVAPAQEPRFKLGAKLPYTRFIDGDGDVIDLETFAGEKKVVLIFMRGFAGFVCPHCTRHTAEVVKNSDGFAQEDAEVLIVYPGPAEKIPKFLAAVRREIKIEGNAPFPFKLLLDVDLDAVKALGIEGALALPSTFILDYGGKLAYEYVGQMASDRPDVADLLDALKGISRPDPS